ncbi:ankyrin repeat and death domain-containing protein 1A-like [Limulus polyphemus]|uniref:Ankyrin repeat and death domain-containing protein 1A-like n=1 Tax=Limulus polyphemus TaxID=6850 RepID=A0ABM1TKY2_LIMPO|nr:ankyrin repeat and death domain-containing protein 1A-like [Limulus polyphemus]
MDRAPVHWAASRGHLDILAMLIVVKCDIESADKYGMRPLLLAAWFGHKGAVQMLVENGANCRATNRQGLNVLHCAVQNNHMDVVTFLLESVENIEVNSCDRNGQTSLHSAVANNNMDIVEQLVKFGADVSIKDKTGSTAVHLAAEKGYHLVLVRLLRVGVEIEDRDEEGRTALHLAAQYNHQKVAEILLEHNCDPGSEDAPDFNVGGRTALYVAARGSFTAIVDLLIGVERELSSKTNQANHSPDQAEKNSFCAEQSDAQHKHMKQVLWTLAKSHLEPSDWRHLARYWKFTEEHMRAIEHQYTGKTSYKDHGYRMMIIWLHGLPPTKNPLKELFEALVAIGKRDVAEKIRRKVEEDYMPRSCTPEKICMMCLIL